ncbi:alpha/beta fold hydrolase [Dyadobacter sp. CY312]|uniref:alpha/beta fold hydrolase n=1 Tax=Dyadobacter sp. CY312 TaxID=2907303 RepID=UPI001F1A3614|nr:alpha/beta hydrolase [Dyadobacter sp. CY312]MCE7039074.1 alpha/beta hydrolase [Dyadobacter sp. CY312]
MKFSLTFLLLFLLVGSNISTAQNLYSKAYGNMDNPAIVYIHGGPRGNATLFEGTTAQTLAQKGYYVIVYDRRGEGRSVDQDAKVTFNEAFSDLNNLIKQYNLTKVSLLGHSFGGIVSTLYTQAFPEKVERLMLIGALFSQQESYDHILSTTLKMATEKKDTATIKKIAQIKTLDRQGAAYRKQTYEVASLFRFFTMPTATEESEKVNKRYETSGFSKSNIRNDNAPLLFYKNESLVNIDTKPVLKKIKSAGVKLSAVYGLQDGIFSAKQLSELKAITGAANFFTIDNCSHYPFVDQQSRFVEIVTTIMNK